MIIRGTADCIQCHGHGGTVEPTDCMACHPLGDPGTCNLSNYHDPRMGTECFTCHTECTGVVTTTTTTIQTFPHYTNTCEQCHLPADLHAGLGHTNCAECHNGAPQVGNVEPANCIVCHPQLGPGSCNLIEGHDPDFGADLPQLPRRVRRRTDHDHHDTDLSPLHQHLRAVPPASRSPCRLRTHQLC